MSDIFISYARQEAPRAAQLARALEASGFAVWWDPQLSAGESWATKIEKELDKARCVIVLWSTNSIKSNWVIDEAAYAREENKLIPVLIDKVQQPLGFRMYQTLELTDWRGEPSHTEFQRLIQVISEKVGK